jgi:hypothetical protein
MNQTLQMLTEYQDIAGHFEDVEETRRYWEFSNAILTKSRPETPHASFKLENPRPVASDTVHLFLMYKSQRPCLLAQHSLGIIALV